jgi:hypothetical protein
MNVVAVGWNVFMAVVFFLPTRVPVTSENVSLLFLGIISGCGTVVDADMVEDELRCRGVCVCLALFERFLVYPWPALLHWPWNTTAWEPAGYRWKSGVTSSPKELGCVVWHWRRAVVV